MGQFYAKEVSIASRWLYVAYAGCRICQSGSLIWPCNCVRDVLYQLLQYMLDLPIREHGTCKVSWPVSDIGMFIGDHDWCGFTQSVERFHMEISDSIFDRFHEWESAENLIPRPCTSGHITTLTTEPSLTLLSSKGRKTDMLIEKHRIEN